MTINSDINHQGVRIPRFIYGTAWKEESTAPLVVKAITAGFTGIDTANQRVHYCEAAVGEGLSECYQQNLISREALFLQTKFTYARGQDHRLPYDPKASISRQVAQSFNSSLEHLGTNYLDAYLLHGPAYTEGLAEDDLEAWQAMETLYKSGQVKSIGISNVNLQQLEALYQFAEIKPVLVQNRCFARLGWDINIRNYCHNHNMLYQGFSLLTANPEILAHPDFTKIVARVQLTPAQTIFQACLGMGMITLTGTTNEQHMHEDLTCTQNILTSSEINLIEKLLIP